MHGNKAKVLSGRVKVGSRAWQKAAAARVLICRARVALLSPGCPQAQAITSQPGHLTPSENLEVSSGENKAMGPPYHNHTNSFWAEITCGQVDHLLESFCMEPRPLGHHRTP